MRVVIYARYSSELQNPKSVEDQIQACKEYAAKRYPNIPLKIYSDKAITGSTMKREGLIQALAYVAHRAPDVVIISEGLDRISRSLSDVANIFDQLTNLRVKLITLAQGEISLMHVGVIGTMSALYLDNMKLQVRRGLRAKAAKGLAAAGLSYGYSVDKTKFDDQGNQIKGARVINPAQAEIVKEIFERYAAGASAKQIVDDLNRRGVRGKAGGVWSVGSLLGNKKLGSGILNQELYRGKMIYGRTREVKVGNKKRWQANDPKDWIVTDVPDLRIVSDDLWDKAQRARLKRYFGTGKRKGKADYPSQRQRTAFSGLITCKRCGGIATLADKKQYLCKNTKQKTGCDNWRRVSQDLVMRTVREVATSYAKENNDWVPSQRLFQEHILSHNKKIEASLATVDDEMENLINALVQGAHHKKVTTKLADLKRKSARLKTELKVIKQDTVPRNPVKLVASALDYIEGNIDNPQERDYVRALISTMIKSVVYEPQKDKQGVTISVEINEQGLPNLLSIMIEREQGISP